MHFHTEREWLEWYVRADLTARPTTPPRRSTPGPLYPTGRAPIERKWITGREAAGSRLKLAHTKPIPIRVTSHA